MMVPDTWYMPLLFANTLGIWVVAAVLFLIFMRMGGWDA